MPALCRDCFELFEASSRCPSCKSPRVVAHDELYELSIAHMDCDAFFASVEKRDNPELRNKPVIIGGGQRGVVSTACYIARIRGVRSAMPMFQALKLCPDAVIVKPRMQAYAQASKQIRSMMDALTPAIEPLSLDEAFIDLSGTARLHGAPPALMLAKLVKRMQTQLGLSGSIGLSHNKFLAKIASDLDKPHGYSVIGVKETASFLHDKPVKLIWGVGRVSQGALEKAGIRTFSDLLRWEKDDLTLRFGSLGARLWHLARGQDLRSVSSRSPVKSISKETTFSKDIMDEYLLDGHLWRLAEQVSQRAKNKGVAGRVVTLKLKCADHRTLTRRQTLNGSSHLADVIYRTARGMFEQIKTKGPFRLIGCGLADLEEAISSNIDADLLDPDAKKRQDAEAATDKIRAKFGANSIKKGRALR